MADEAPGELTRALELFDAGHYHAAHEVLDGLWESTHGADANFYKGLIQAAIAMHHFARGNDEGARKLYAGQRRLLAPYLPAHLGLDVAGFFAELARVLGPLARGGTAGHAFREDQRPRVDFLGSS